MSEKLITFGQLLRIKREQLNLTQDQVERDIKLSGLSSYENDRTHPRRPALAKLIDFYKITDDEMSNLKPAKGKSSFKPEKNKILVEEVVKQLQSIEEKVEGIDKKGQMASTIRKTALEHIQESITLLEDILIVDRLI